VNPLGLRNGRVLKAFVSSFSLLEQANPEGHELAARLRAEHDTIRPRCEKFDNSLQFALDLEDGLNKTVLRDVFIYGSGSKHHVLTDAQGIPLAATVTAANVNEEPMRRGGFPQSGGGSR
jgi:hypothetical protein